jgi:hypothetical protein
VRLSYSNPTSPGLSLFASNTSSILALAACSAAGPTRCRSPIDAITAGITVFVPDDDEEVDVVAVVAVVV